MRLFAFSGLRYGSTGGEPGRLAAPPFDQIDRATRDRLHQLDPRQFAHLTRPVGGEQAAANAARLHQEWCDQGAVIREASPSIYPYEIELAGGGRRLGICALIGIEPPGSDRIRPHEHTVSRTISERLALLQATRTDFEPILLMSDDRGGLERLLVEDLGSGPALAEHTDPEGHRHRLTRIDSPERIAAYREVLDASPAVIADGHHRYRVAQLFSEEFPDAPPAARAKLAVVTSLRSPGLTIEPIHRLLEQPFAANAVTDLIVDRRVVDSADGASLAQEVADARQPAVAVWSPPKPPQIWRLEPATGPKRLTRAASDLAVVLLHSPVLERAGFPEAAATDGSIRYRSDPRALHSEIVRKPGATGFWLPPMAADAFAAAVADGDLLPPKSTRFVPKLVSGLVWSPHDADLS